MVDPSTLERLTRYLTLRYGRANIKRYLGGGTDGQVWETDVGSVVKVLERAHGYFNERDSYLRLQEWGVIKKINEFWVPELIAHHDEHLVVEMDFVHDFPYIIDFAKVKLDQSPEFSEEQLADATKNGIEWFGENWHRVQALLSTLESYQIYYLDPRPGNIVFDGMS